MMQIHKLKTQKTGRVATSGNSRNPGQVWLICHGYGQLATAFLEKFSVLDEEKNFLVSIEGLHRFYTRGTGGRVGASWMTKEEREDDIEDYLCWMDKVYEAFVPRFPGAKVILLGFSQGGATVCRWLERSHHTIDHLVLYASAFPPDVVPSGKFSRNIGGKIVYVLGSADEYVNAEEKERQLSLLQASGHEISTLDFEGGHGILPEVLKRLERLL